MERRSIAKGISEISGTKLPRHISIYGNTFSAIDDAGTRAPIGPLLHCVIVDFNEKGSRIFWGADKVFNEEDKSPPLCWSDNGIAPSVRCQEPQAPSCRPDREGKEGCRWSVWGSATGKGGVGIPACRNGVKLAVILVKLVNKQWVPMLEKKPGMLWYLWVPPASLKSVASYGKAVRSLGKINQIPWTGETEVPYDLQWLITRISFRGQGTLEFEHIGEITEQIDGIIGEIAQSEVDMFIGRDDEPIAELPPTGVSLPQDVHDYKGLGTDDWHRPELQPPALPQPKPSIAAERKQRGRPRKENGAPAAPRTPNEAVQAKTGFVPKPNPQIVTAEDVRNHAARERQEAKEAEQFGMTEQAPEPPEDVLDQFMNLDLK